MTKFIGKALFVTSIVVLVSSCGLIPATTHAADLSSDSSYLGDWGSNSYTGSWGSTDYSGSTGSSYTGSWGTPSYSGDTGSSYTGSWGSTDYSGSTGSSYTGSWGTPSYSGDTGSSYTGSWGSTSYTGGSGATTPTYTYTDYGATTPTYTYTDYGATTPTTPTYTYTDYGPTATSYTYPSYSQPTTYTYPSYSNPTTYTYPTYSYPSYHNTTGGNNPVTYQPVCQIYANPSSVAYNGSTTVTWNSNYATSASLSEVGSVATNGSYTFNNLTGNHTYVLTVSGQGGTNTCSTVVYVQPQTQTPTCTIYSNPTSVQSGGSSTVTWNSTNATSASLSEVGSVATNGAYTFNNLTTTKTYILTVTGQGGTNTCSTSVGVYDNQQQTPYCTLTINPSTINNNYNYNYNYNNSAVMSWTATNATSASIDGIGSVNAYSGSQTIYPGYSRTYTMHVYGNNGQSNTCTAYVNVQQNQQNNLWCTISVQPQYVTTGGSAVIMWTSGGATNAWLSDGIGSVSTNGNRTVYPNGAHTYTLTVNDGSGNTQTCSTSVNGTSIYTPTTPTYVSLTQIPYTGFDFGPVGNTIYWAVLASGAAAAAYLMTMYRGGAMNYGLALLGVRSNHIVASEDGEDEEEEPAEDEPREVIEEDEEEEIPAGDAMTLEMVNGMPRLSINRVKKGIEGLPGQN